MQPIPTYEDLPVVFDTAPQVEIPVPTIDSGYGEGVALPTEHFSWLEYKITKKIDELARTVTSLITEMDNYLTSRSVTPNGTAYNQFLTALAAQIAGASVARAAACTGNSATATIAGQCTGNSSTATKLATPRTITVNGDATGSTSFDGSGNVTLTLDVTSANTSQACSGNAATATNAGYATSAGTATSAGYATSAGTATSATNATNSNSVNNISFASGAAGSDRLSWTLSPSGRLIIPSGTYVIVSTASSQPVLSVKNNAGFWSPSGSSAAFGGFMVSDGINFSLINTSASVVAIEYRKLA